LLTELRLNSFLQDIRWAAMEAAHPDIDLAAMLGCWRRAKSWFVEFCYGRATQWVAFVLALGGSADRQDLAAHFTGSVSLKLSVDSAGRTISFSQV